MQALGLGAWLFYEARKKEGREGLKLASIVIQTMVGCAGEEARHDDVRSVGPRC